MLLSSHTISKLQPNGINTMDYHNISGGSEGDKPYLEIQGSFGGNAINSIQGGGSVTAHIPVPGGVTISPTVVVDTSGHVLNTFVRFDFPFFN